MKLKIEISDDDAMHIGKLIERTQLYGGGFNSHGPLTMRLLAEMLMQDVALAVRRPRSWEGANMAHVLESHGYSF
jgi:hypothetical protein